MKGLFRRLKELLSRKPKLTPELIAAMACDCDNCGKPATRVFYHTREEWGYGNTAGWIIHTCDDDTCTQKARSEKSLAVEEYTWPYHEAIRA